MTVTGKDAYAAQSGYANRMGRRDDAEFIEAFLSDHRTLQSQTMSLWLRTIYAWVEHGNRYAVTDARNEAAFRKAEAIVEALGPDGWAVPFI